MRSYLRNRAAGGCYFFTVTLANRIGNDLLVREIDLLRDAVRAVKARHPFEIDAMVVLPEHLHALWTLPEGDSNYSSRWRLVKARFSERIERTEAISASRVRRGERGIWQRRFWEHTIRDDLDFQRHVDYIHFNPVKHGHCAAPRDWPHSSFHRWVKAEVYPIDWAVDVGEVDGED